MNNINYNDFFTLAHNSNLKDIQITEKTNIYVSSEVINGQVISKENGNNINYLIQADYDGRTIKLESNYLDEKIINLLIEKGKYLNNKKIDIVKDLSRNNKIDDIPLLSIENDIQENIKLKELIKDNWILKTNIESNYSKVRIINDLGVDISSSNIVNSFNAEIIIKLDGSVKTKSTSILFNKDDKINYNNIVSELINEAILSTNEIKIDSGKYKVLFKNNIMNIILKKLPSCLNKKVVNDKTSFLESKLNSKIFSDKVNILENPLDKNMPGYRTFDDEGTSTYNKTIVEKGKLLTYLCDNKTAKEDNIKSTGNSYGEVSTRNMILECGNSSYKDLIRKLDNGIIVYNMISFFSSSVNDSTLSFQAYGLLVENGEIKGGLKSFIVTASYFELFNNIEEIGNDLLFNNGVCASPSVIANDINITI